MNEPSAPDLFGGDGDPLGALARRVQNESAEMADPTVPAALAAVFAHGLPPLARERSGVLARLSALGVAARAGLAAVVAATAVGGGAVAISTVSAQRSKPTPATTTTSEPATSTTTSMPTTSTNDFVGRDAGGVDETPDDSGSEHSDDTGDHDEANTEGADHTDSTTEVEPEPASVSEDESSDASGASSVDEPDIETTEASPDSEH